MYARASVTDFWADGRGQWTSPGARALIGRALLAAADTYRFRTLMNNDEHQQQQNTPRSRVCGFINARGPRSDRHLYKNT